MSDRANVLLILPDQQRGDSLGLTSGGIVQTPNLDRLAREGVLFNNAISQSPLCQPARASFLTGRYPHEHGCVVNERTFPMPTDPNFVRTLKDAGYYTASVGKIHIGVVPQGQQRWPYLQQFGFDEMDEAFGKMAYLRANNRYTQLLDDAGVLEAFRTDLLERLAKMGEQGLGGLLSNTDFSKVEVKEPWYAGPTPVPVELFIDNYVGDLAVDWLRRYDREEPFFLWVGFCGPHDPHDAPQGYADPYLALGDKLPVGTMEPPEDTPSDSYNNLLNFFRRYSGTGQMEPDHVRRIMAFYYGGITLIDHRVGEILSVLDERGWADNTWIVYTSDHGDVLGEHQMLAKVVLYDGSISIPLIVRPPGGMQGRVIDDPVELADAAATILAGVGLDPVRGSRAQSLTGYTTGADPEPRRAVYTEVMGFSCVVTGRYKYAVERDSGTACVLFDLEADPDENRNLANDPSTETLRKQLAAEYLEPFLTRA